MESKHKMEARPPALMQAVVRLLIPPACREHVLGDLCERYRSRRQYVFEALTTIPAVVASRIRRTSSVGLLAMQAIGVCVAFWKSTPSGLVEMVTSAAGALIMLVARDAYRSSVQAWPRTAAIDALAAVAGAVAVQGVVAAVANASSFNPPIVLGNSRRRFHASRSRPRPVRTRFSRVGSCLRGGRVGRGRSRIGASVRGHGRARHEPGCRPRAHEVSRPHLGDHTDRG